MVVSDNGAEMLKPEDIAQRMTSVERNGERIWNKDSEEELPTEEEQSTEDNGVLPKQEDDKQQGADGKDNSDDGSLTPPTTDELIEMARQGNELAQYQLEEQGISWEDTNDKKADDKNQSALARIPKDNDGSPIYEQTDADTAWDAIVEQTDGDEDMAQSVADSMVADKEKALHDVENAEIAQSGSVADKIAAAKQHKQNIDNAKAELEHWKEIAGTLNRRGEQDIQKQPTEQTYNDVVPQTDNDVQADEAQEQPTDVDEEKAQQTKDRNVPISQDDTKVKTENNEANIEDNATKQKNADDNGVSDWFQDLHLSGELDQNNSPFILSTNGQIDFGQITEEHNLPAAPVRLSLGDAQNGYIHINRRHGKEIQKAGFNSIESFVEYVINNFTRVKKGASYDNEKGGKNNTYLVQLQDGHNNTLFVQLSRDGSYWNVNSAGVFGKKYGDKKEEIWSASEVQNDNSAIASDGSQSEPIAEKGSSSNGTPSKSSTSEDTANSTELQGNGKESSQNGFAPDEKVIEENVQRSENGTKVSIEASKDGAIAETEKDTNAIPKEPNENKKPIKPTENRPKETKQKNSGQFGLVSDERMEELKRKLRAKLNGQLNVGIDPEILTIAAELATGYIDRGLKAFSDFAKAMIDDIGDVSRPYIKMSYNAARDWFEENKIPLYEEMTPYEEVKRFDVANYGREHVDTIEQAKQIANEQKVEEQAKKIKGEKTSEDKGDTPLSTKIATASTEVNTEPTEAQKETIGNAPAKEEATPTKAETKQTKTSESKGYTITPSTYTNKKGKTSNVSLLTFNGELTAEQERAVKEFAKEKLGDGRYAPTRGWKDRESGGWIFRSEEDARKAAELVSGNEAKTGQAETKQDNQGNPLNADGTLKLEKVTSVDDLTDEDFSAPTRNVELPTLPKTVDDAIGANGKPVVIKKNIFEKNKKSHKDLTPEQSRKILTDALYHPNLYGQNQKTSRPYNWILIHNAEKHSSVILEVSHNKDNVEIVNWHYLDDATLERKKRQAVREGGLILTLESAAANTHNDLSSTSKDTTKSITKQPKADTKQLDEAIAKAEKEGNLEEVKNLKAEKAFCEKHIPEKGDKKVGYKKQKDTLNITSIVNGKEVRAQLRGIHYENGFAVATDGYTIVITRQEYPTEYEGKTIGKNGEAIDLKFPIWVNAIPMLNSDEYSRSEFEDVLKDASKRYKEFKKKYKEEHPEAKTINVENEMVEYEIYHQILLDKESGINVTDANLLLNILEWCGEEARVFKFKGKYYTLVFIKSKGAYALMMTRIAEDRQESDTRLIGKAKPIAETTEETKQPILKKEEKPANANNKKKKTEASNPTDNKDKEAPQDKIDDVGEKIDGARKDALKKLAESIEQATEEALVAMPFSKAFKRPNLKKAVEDGVLREEDALFAQAVMSAYLSRKKPLMSKSRSSYERERSEKTIKVWAHHAYNGVEKLKKLFSLSPSERDTFMREEMNRPAYDPKDVEKRKQDLMEWNPGKVFNGTCYPINAIRLWNDVYTQLGYEVGTEVPQLFSEVLPTTGYDSYVLVAANGTKFYPARSLNSYNAVVDEIVYQTKVANADADTDHPKETFKVIGSGEMKTKSSGKWYVVTQASLSARPHKDIFSSKEEAEKFAKAYIKNDGKKVDKYRYASAPQEVKEIDGYSEYAVVLRRKNIGKGTTTDFKLKHYNTADEARAAIDAEHDELNELANKELAKDKGSKSASTKKPICSIEVYTEDGKSWKYGIVLSDKYAPKKSALNTMPYYLAKDFNTRKEAQAYLDAHKEEIEAKAAEVDEARRNFKYFTANGEREGNDYRKGEDVTAEQFREQFGFRGVQFGNWTNQRDRQEAVNQAFDAFMDLSRILGVSPKALSLNGELGIAFGARGSGKALAHYEPSQVVINLTKTNGAGSLAHEWWHALDNYFARQGNVAMGFVTQSKNIEMRDELRQAFNTLIDHLEKSPYNQRSKQRGSSYWGTPIEETARMFEQWVNDQLAERGEKSPFLTDADPYIEERYAQMNYEMYKFFMGDKAMPYEEYKQTPQALNGLVYLTRDELQTFGKDLKHIFDTIQQKVDETTGKTLMYHKGDVVFPLNHVETTLRDVVIEHLRKNGFNVITDVRTGQRVLELAKGEARLSAKQKRALETVTMAAETTNKATAISSADGAKIQNNLETLATGYDKRSNTTKGFITDLSKALNLEQHEASHYGTFETRDGSLVTIRVSNHNARVSFFDKNEEDNGISIVISNYRNKGLLNDGSAHIVEFFYPKQSLQRSEVKPLVEIIKSISEALNSGKFEDTTGIAQRQEVNADIDHVRFFRTADGEAYGFTYGGDIYIEPSIASSETPIHEYAHLWASALRAENKKEWQNVVDLMKGTSVWDEVKRTYPELKTDDDIADEVLATYSGRRGAERLRKEMDKAMSEGTATEKGAAVSTLERVKQAIEKFWHAVADFLHIHYTSAEQVADQVMKDLLDGVDPRMFGKEDSGKARYQFVGEKGAERADHAEEVTTRLDNLNTAREMEAAKKDAKSIKLATGWERGADGKWRYEIPDSKLNDMMDVDGNGKMVKRYEEDMLWTSGKLGEVIVAPELFKAYPKLKDVRLETDSIMNNLPSNGEYNSKTNTITIHADELKYLNSILNHEIQHAIQDLEGFAKGGNPNTLELKKTKEYKDWENLVARLRSETPKEKALNTLIGDYADKYNALADKIDEFFYGSYDAKNADDVNLLQERKSYLEELGRYINELSDELDKIRKGRGAMVKSTIDSVDDVLYNLYHRLAGEVESRNVEKRMGMPPEERRATLAAETEDVSREDQIFLMGEDNNVVSEEKTKSDDELMREGDMRNPYEMSESEKAEIGNALVNAPTIDVASNQIVKTEDMSARKAAEKWWRDNIGEPLFYDTEVGVVEINENSIGTSLAHRYGQAKLDAITSLKDGFKNAVYLGTIKDFIRTEKSVLNHYFAYPINYNGKRCYVFCRAMQDNNKNRLYVHTRFLLRIIYKKRATPFKPQRRSLTEVLPSTKQSYQML